YSLKGDGLFVPMDAKIIYLEALAAGSGLAETDSPLEGTVEWCYWRAFCRARTPHQPTFPFAPLSLRVRQHNFRTKKGPGQSVVGRVLLSKAEARNQYRGMRG